MECQHCLAALNPDTTLCPQCGHFVNPQVEVLISRAAAEIKARSPQAEATFREAALLIPIRERDHLRRRVQQVLQPASQAAESPVGAGISEDPEQAVSPTLPAVPATHSPVPDPAPPEAVAAPPSRPKPPPSKGGAQQLFLDFNQPPWEVVQVMDEIRQKTGEYQARRRRRMLWLWLLFPLGFLFVLADVVLGYNICTFSLVALTLWIGAIVGLISIGRQGKVAPFGPRYDLVRTIFETIKDDVNPKKTMVGWLDLTGAEQSSKKVREKNSASGQPVIYYRDEWLRLKTNLYDGNILRLSVVQRVKARQGFWKRSRISGKNKYRSGSSQSQAEIQFSISVDTSRYELLPFEGHTTAIPNSRFVITGAEAGNGRVELDAMVPSGQFDAWDILNALRFGYNHIRGQQGAA